MIVRKMQWRKILFIHFFFSFIIGWVIFFSITFIELITRQLSLKTALKNFTFENFINVADLNFLIYTAMVGIIYIYYYIEELKKIEAQKSKLSIQLNNTKLNLLKSNLHPHFLFNTLNSISSLIETDTKQAQNTVADLGGLLRDFLDVKDQNLITLEQELNTLVKYINILEVRFPDHFTFISDIDDKLLQAQFPIFLLQPIIENSIKHGYSYDKTDLDVYLSIEREGEMVIITIANNGKLIPKKFLITHKNIGLTNTLERLQSLYKDNFNFFMKNKKDNSGVITHIAIPYISTIKKENV
ncbi:histidine kinase [uncultured Polaribacter sp.]|uniref:sensor histidine kinase n=1 Tax=uncultured Polaribacter sp. TaxID=174711 RepID=UPI0026084917|nr:histidine kinase [uncultured Polaribacter sp.]